MPQPTFLMASLLVAVGGAIGSWCRFLVGTLWTFAIGPARASVFPWATLSVNIIGSIAMGLLAGWLSRFAPHGETARLFLAVGVLGGFTTFSSFSLDMVLLAQRGQIGLAVFYAAISVIAGFIGLFGGLMLMRSAA